ncbi:MAG TPA: heme-binding domain-containing protein [Pyrinomonadaceae bacterium]|nr:heme-binding domain-containing protein [Pyrinomonadaceae bacterium]
MKARLRTVIKWLLILAVCLFVIAQFKRPARTNPAFDESAAIETHAQLDPKIAAILDRSCNDCHSNKTRWPWYANVAPMSWFVIDHVEEGREHMNLSEWGSYSPEERKALLREVCDLVSDGTMPLSSYTPLHPGSKLSDADKKAMCEWAAAERARIR